jgi:Family of unknown function (DUF6088)
MKARPASKTASQPTPNASLGALMAQRLSRAGRKQPAKVFTPSDFLDLGTPHAVGMVLSRMVRSGTLRRLARGLYDVPRTHPLLGNLLPSTDEVVKAIARRSGVVVQPLDVDATNLLGLSEQVVAQPVYETNGPSRKVQVGDSVIEFKHRSPRSVTAAAESSNLVFAALRGLGKQHVTLARVAHLRKLLPAKERAQLLKTCRWPPCGCTRFCGISLVAMWQWHPKRRWPDG